ncbi:DUF742 domain-containing protein [Streptomyces sp. NPDC001678]|uniref:DUF742 domain-containing protein n=1 Tax=Streptomyces sp. NPDC001678 TaxID=3364599 RepID=UPI0036B86633
MSTAAPVLRAPAGPVPDRRTARVRPYSLTGGRGRCGHVLLMETFVAALADTDDGRAGAEDGRGDACGPGALAGPGGALASWLLPEVRAVLGLCRRLRSVAEVSALLRMPLGVVRVLLGDLADQGRIRVYGTGHLTGRPDRALLERVLSGLRRL